MSLEGDFYVLYRFEWDWTLLRWIRWGCALVWTVLRVQRLFSVCYGKLGTWHFHDSCLVWWLAWRLTEPLLRQTQAANVCMASEHHRVHVTGNVAQILAFDTLLIFRLIGCFDQVHQAFCYLPFVLEKDSTDISEMCTELSVFCFWMFHRMLHCYSVSCNSSVNLEHPESDNSI